MTTNADITIYNRIANREKARYEWRSHYIPAVSFYTDQKSSFGDAGTKREDIYKIRIPEESLEGYKTPEEFHEDPGTGWTVEKEDLFVVGQFGEIDGIKDLEKLHRPYGTVKSWSDNRRGCTAHIRITGGV